MSDAKKFQPAIQPVEVYFELGRFKLRKALYHPGQLEDLTIAQRLALPAVPKLVYVNDDFYGADLVLHEKAFERALEQLFIQGQMRWKRRLKATVKFLLISGSGFALAKILEVLT